MPFKDKYENRAYQRLWQRALLERETPEELKLRLERKSSWAKNRRKQEYCRDREWQRDHRKKMNQDVSALFEEASYVWYIPETDDLVIRLADQAMTEESLLMILIGKF